LSFVPSSFSCWSFIFPPRYLSTICWFSGGEARNQRPKTCKWTIGCLLGLVLHLMFIHSSNSLLLTAWWWSNRAMLCWFC
jgi:hypothetical protein